MNRAPGYGYPRALTPLEKAALKGADGAAGPKGDTGAQGPKGDIGLTGLTGAKGDTGSQGPKGDTGAQGIQGIQGAQGTPGTNGTNGTNGATWTTLPDVTFSDGGIVIALGPRKKSFACVGAIVGDRLAVFAPAGTPAGYVVGDVCCKVAGQVEVSFYGPALTVLVTNTFVLKVLAFR